MTDSPRRSSRARSLFRLLWRVPLLAIPFAVFFGTVYGASRSDYFGAYVLALVFALAISLANWCAGVWIVPRLQRGAARRRAPWHEIAVHAGASVFGATVAALIVHLWIVPGFLGTGRSIAIVLMYTLLFTALFLGVSYAIAYYRDSVERVKSEQELTLARRIQRSFLLSSFPTMPTLEVHALNVSSKQVSGDFYDVVPAGDDAFLLAVADVAGKGVPAALLSSMLQASLRTQALTTASVAEILRTINQLVYRSTATEQFATFFLARVHEPTLSLAYANAGHNFPIVFRRGGGRETLECGGTVVGILDHAGFDEAVVRLAPGDRVVFYTDGISEAARGTDLFGEERLAALVESLPPDLDARGIAERILDGVRAHLDGAEAGDDMTLMVLRVLEPAALETRGGAATPSAAHPRA